MPHSVHLLKSMMAFQEANIWHAILFSGTTKAGPFTTLLPHHLRASSPLLALLPSPNPLDLPIIAPARRPVGLRIGVQMEAAVGAASSLIGKVLMKLSDDLVAAYVDSLELGPNSEQITTDLEFTQGLLHAAQGRDVSDNPGLRRLLDKLSKKADEAEDALDELHYFMIQDLLDGTQEAALEVGDGLRGHALHGRHAVRHIGNWLPCFSCSRTQDDDSTATAVTTNPQNTTTSDSGNYGGRVDKLSFDRVDMSNKIKLVIEGLRTLCAPVSDLLNKIPTNTTTVTLKRPHIGSTIVQYALYGRRVIFEKTVDDITGCKYQDEILSVLPIVGPGGIGKTTFSQYLYNNTRMEEHFTVKVWVCVSTDFDVLKLTQQIGNCIPTTEKEGSSIACDKTNLDQLQKSIAKRLKSHRFLIVLDDIWKCSSEDEWKTLLAPFTKGKVLGSMVLVTTRFPFIANMVKTTNPVELQGLESTDFFEFFEACIFGENKPAHYEDELAGISKEIASKLKGSPLAAKTVGRLLRKNLSQEHWMGVFGKHEWLNQQNNDDILPSLKISYDYLPFVLKKCFSYFSLFPEDHVFKNLEMNRFWVAIGIIDYSHRCNKNYLEELWENGFLMKAVDSSGEYYVMHNLMHELSRSVSTQECLNISDLDFRAEVIPQSIRHLSITIENKYDEKFGEEMSKIKRNLNIRNLRTLMIFREYEERIDEILKDTFKEINGLRVLFIVVKSLESLPRNFSKLIHLQYLKIGSPYDNYRITLPTTLSMFYHLKFLDLEDWNGSYNLPKDISRLVNLHDFLAEKELHSNVPEVGKMKYLQELKEFDVKKKSVGFELRELGDLRELGGRLSICNLENVATKEEASGAKLMFKRDLKGLILVWGAKQPTTDAGVLEGLQPHPNLRGLHIINHGGITGPSWLCLDILVKSLQTLNLNDVSWGTLPPFGQLPHLKELSLKNISGVRRFGPDYGGITSKCFLHLKRIMIDSMPELVEWVVEPNCHFFPSLESINCEDCPNLCVMPFSECSCPELRSLHIRDCPRLSLPPMPHTSKLTDITVAKSGENTLAYYNEKRLVVAGYDGPLAFHNLHKVETMNINDVSHISLTNLAEMDHLRNLDVQRCDSMFSEELNDNVLFNSVQMLSIDESHLTRKLLSQVFVNLPALPELKIYSFPGDDEERVMQFPSSSSLQKLTFSGCKGLVLIPAEDGGGIQDITSLQSLTIEWCGKLFSRWAIGEAGGAQAINPFPSSLMKLCIDGESSMQSMALLSNLTSLTHLSLEDCYSLTMDGFNPLITVNLRKLVVINFKRDENDPESLAADILSEMTRIKLIPPGSFQLQHLEVDSISAVLVAPICNLLAATLLVLDFWRDKQAGSFTEEQEKALHLLTSLQMLQFNDCKRIISLPQGLHCLSSLKALQVSHCDELRFLPDEGFPTSLRYLSIKPYPLDGKLKEQLKKLEGRNPNLCIVDWD